MHSSFVLEQEATFSHLARATLKSRWVEFAHKAQRELGFLLLANEIMQLPQLDVPPEPVLWLRVIRPDTAEEDVEVSVWDQSSNKSTSAPLVSVSLQRHTPGECVRELLLDLPMDVGHVAHLEVRCAGKERLFQKTDRVGIVGLVICSRVELPLWRARAHKAWRVENEIAHFQNVYNGDFYKGRHVDRGACASGIGAIRKLPARPDASDGSECLRQELIARLLAVKANTDENAFGYATRLLGTVIPDRPPNYPLRLAALAQATPRKLRMLALCAGEAAVEGQILAAANVPVELCIVDLNDSLLERSSLQVPEGVTLDRVLGDANDIGPQLGLFDVICITSGLHHLVELEHVLSTIAELLEKTGEFWLIGEQIGRNGNRLWPEALARANEIFLSWPSEKRINRHTGRLDGAIPDTDFSAGCFEGIRSEEIIALLNRYFLPVVCYMRNAFLWRLVDATYSANFNLGESGDRRIIAEAVADEALLWAKGGRCTEMHAVFQSKWAGLTALCNPSERVR
jgi:hypothetical protein